MRNAGQRKMSAAANIHEDNGSQTENRQSGLCGKPFPTR
jgi:hypothetical protein